MCGTQLLALGLSLLASGVLGAEDAGETFVAGDIAAVQLGTINSPTTLLPFAYTSLGFCAAQYSLEVLKDTECAVLCRHTLSDAATAAHVVKAIRDQYVAQWSLAGLPAATRVHREADAALTSRPREGRAKDDAAAAAAATTAPPTRQDRYERGFDIGSVEELRPGTADASPPRVFVNNHVRFHVYYHTLDDETDRHRIVAFEVEPFSVKHEALEGNAAWDALRPNSNALATCSSDQRVDGMQNPQPVEYGVTLVFTFDVQWHKSTTAWAERWEIFSRSAPSARVRWFSAVNSAIVVAFLASALALVVCAIAKDGALAAVLLALGGGDGGGNGGYGGGGAQGAYIVVHAAAEEGGGSGLSFGVNAAPRGWKAIRDDVQRPPRRAPRQFAIAVGTGAQLTVVMIAFAALAAAGILAPIQGGGAVPGGVAFASLYAISGALGGYTAAWVGETLGLQPSRATSPLTALLFPLLIGALGVVSNSVRVRHGSSDAVAWRVVLSRGAAFALASLFTTGVGGAFRRCGRGAGGTARLLSSSPAYTQRRRAIPPKPCHLRAFGAASLLGGLLPFGALFAELFHLLNSLWLNRVYTRFALLLGVVLIAGTMCALSAAIITSLQLAAEDHEWRWKSFTSAASAGAFLFVYSVVYYVTQLPPARGEDAALRAAIFFATTAQHAALLALCAGSIGFLSAHALCWAVYGGRTSPQTTEPARARRGHRRIRSRAARRERR